LLDILQTSLNIGQGDILDLDESVSSDHSSYAACILIRE
jgi:hypothetical protein